MIVLGRDLVRTFPAGQHPDGSPNVVTAINGVDLDVDEGELVVLRGRSGAGKTTLLNIVSGLDQPDRGTIEVCGVDVHSADHDERARLRREHVGLVFQSFGLLPLLDAGENVEIGLRLLDVDPHERQGRVADALALVGLTARASHRPGELSGGEQQRVAVARALATRPRLLVADEPTGQLDSTTGREIMELLRRVCDERGTSMLIATHDPAIAEQADRVLDLLDGRLTTSV